jgi:hypothetical protein
MRFDAPRKRTSQTGPREGPLKGRPVQKPRRHNLDGAPNPKNCAGPPLNSKKFIPESDPWGSEDKVLFKGD